MSVNSLSDTVRFFVIISGELALLFVGISFLVGLIQEYVPPEKIQKVLGGHRSIWLNNVIGAAFGALTPFCSCSTIPIALGLLNSGIRFGAAMSFLIASPLLNPVIMSLMLALLGMKITFIYALIIFPAAVLTGYLWEKIGLAAEVKNVTISKGCCCAGSNCEEGAGETSRVTRAFLGAWTLFRQMVPWLLVGAGIGSLIYGLIPEDLVVKIAGPQNPLAIPVAAIVGVPMYIRTETILPIGKVLLSKGMGIGAIMALMIGGSGASIPEVSLLAAIFKKRLVFAFIITIFILAVFSGGLFEILT